MKTIKVHRIPALLAGLILAGSLAAAHAGSATSAFYSSQDELILAGAQKAAGDNYGSAIAVGDINGDGFADAIISAPGESGSGLSGAGNVYVYFGTSAGLPSNPSLVLSGTQKAGSFGTSVSVGDLNGDGYPEIIVGAPGETSGAGNVYIYNGKASGVSGTPSLVLYGTQNNGNFGTSVAAVGDINHDGFGDLVVGAPNESSNGVSKAGNAYVFDGSLSGVKSRPTTTLPAPPAPANNGGGSVSGFGSLVGSAGDVNNDGYKDIIINVGLPYAGSTQDSYDLVYLGSSVGVNALSVQYLAGYLFASGDFNGDGYADIATSTSAAGGIAIYFGSPSGISTIARESFQLAQAEYTGIVIIPAVTSLLAADVNHDGYSDLLVGSTNGGAGGGIPDSDPSPYQFTIYRLGRTDIFLGSGSGLSTTSEESVTGNTFGPTAIHYSSGDGDAFGAALGAGDFAGNGATDIVVGAPFDYQNDLSQPIGQGPGVAYVFIGSAANSGGGSSSGSSSSSSGATSGSSSSSSGSPSGSSSSSSSSSGGSSTSSSSSGGSSASTSGGGGGGGGAFDPLVLLALVGFTALRRRVTA